MSPSIPREHGQTLIVEEKQSGPAAGRATRLTILCRGATVANRQSRFSAAEPLLPREQVRLAALARELRAFDTVLHAPEHAATETAAAFGSQAAVCPPLRDVDYGEWNDRSVADIAERRPEDLRAWRNDPASAPHGGESFAAAQARAAGWLDLYRPAGGNVLAVTHAVVVKLLFLHVVGAPLSAIWRVDIEPLGMLTLTGDGRRWALRGFGSHV